MKIYKDIVLVINIFWNLRLATGSLPLNTWKPPLCSLTCTPCEWEGCRWAGKQARQGVSNCLGLEGDKRHSHITSLYLQKLCAQPHSHFCMAFSLTGTGFTHASQHASFQTAAAWRKEAVHFAPLQYSEGEKSEHQIPSPCLLGAL